MISFWNLLYHSYRFDAQRQLERIEASVFSYLEKTEQQQLFEQYKSQARDIIDEMDDYDESGLDLLEKFLKAK